MTNAAFPQNTTTDRLEKVLAQLTCARRTGQWLSGRTVADMATVRSLLTKVNAELLARR